MSTNISPQPRSRPQLDQLTHEFRGDFHATELGIAPSSYRKVSGFILWMQKLHGADESGWSSLDVRDQEVMTVIGQKRAD